MKTQKGNFLKSNRFLFVSEEYKSECGVYSENDFKIIENDSGKIKSAMEYCDYLLHETVALVNKYNSDCEDEIVLRWEEYERKKNEVTHRDEKIRKEEAEKLSLDFLERSGEIIKRWHEEIKSEKVYLQKKSEEMVFEAIHKLMNDVPDRKKIKTLLSHLKMEVFEGEITVLKCHGRQEKKVRDCLNILEINQWQVKVDNDCKEYELRLMTKNEDLWISWDALMSLCNRQT